LTADAFTVTPNVAMGTKGNNFSHARSTELHMAMDDAMINRLDGIRRSYQALTERLADPDVIADSNLLMKVMSDRSKSEDVVTAFEEVSELIVKVILLFLNLVMHRRGW
jgi:hypothetical protein